MLGGVLSFLAILGTGVAARGVEIHPFYAGHFSPLVQTFGIPPAEDGEIAARGTVLTRLVFDLANSYHGGAGPRQSSSLDGETLRTTLALRYGFTPRFEGGVDIPFVHHSGGFLDGFIESFHQAIGKPKNDGEGNPRNQLAYLLPTGRRDDDRSPGRNHRFRRRGAFRGMAALLPKGRGAIRGIAGDTETPHRKGKRNGR